MKSSNKKAVTLFLIWLAVLAQGVHRSDMGPPGPMIPNVPPGQMDGWTVVVRFSDELG